jgi:hypothetical protein
LKTLAVLVAIGLVATMTTGCLSTSSCASPNCTRVLFIGNSLTYVNDLPHTFAALAASGHHRVTTGMLATGGATLANHVGDPRTNKQLDGHHWNIVVLQDESEQPAVEQYRQSEMFPAAGALASRIRLSGATPLFYLTFSWRAGLPQNGLPDYVSMQSAADDGYVTVGRQLGIAVAPVGVAWSNVVNGSPTTNLWQSDGVHPTVAGTYLAACVLYATIFRQSPIGLHDHDGLSADEARQLQTVASETVLSHVDEWGLSNLTPAR